MVRVRVLYRLDNLVEATHSCFPVVYHRMRINKMYLSKALDGDIFELFIDVGNFLFKRLGKMASTHLHVYDIYTSVLHLHQGPV